MPRQPRVQSENAIYHVMSHSMEGFKLFDSWDDFRLFVGILADTQHDYCIRVYAYCLLHTHYHILLQTPLANLSKALQYLNGVYAMGYNARKSRVGHVMQSRYEYRIVEDQDYFERVTHYVITNPVSAGMVDCPEEWAFSSCRATAKLIPVPKFLDADGLLEMLGQRVDKTFLDFAKEPAPPGWEFSRDLVLLRPTLQSIFEKRQREKAILEAIQRWEYRRAEAAHYLGMSSSNIGKILRKFPDGV